MFASGKMLNIAGVCGNYRNILSIRNVLNNSQSYAGLNGKALEKLGLPQRPKRPLTPFFKYMQMERPKITAEHPGLTNTDTLRKLAQNWTKYDPKEKEALQKIFEQELTTYSKQTMAYEKSITAEHKQIIRDAKEQAKIKTERSQLKKKYKLLGKPKKPATSFLQYLHSTKHMKSDNVSVTDWIKSCAEKWNNLDPKMKEKYEIEGRKLMEQYKDDIKEWEEKMVRLGHIDVIRNRGLIDLKSPKSE